ncbi:DNA-directed RNA polymerase III subunit C31 [Aspergillus glaucus CBS 516.65]|uniref:DNA-directed RNA polymerase III subunit n=1 Tax=Aspergillus glaucus CBS 516.65 TaxID=1160497 RepID=A0A1L9VTU6_ASPGL|nr:hypothetical protein ASPGLDRAFT_43865 [Aspergillus glaucus CBS 516.65]OJJ87329.1 hypothetical protein ASPGLDRAFT_43865 [Aspergillus glaucus CBS 516.65]
MSRFGAKKGRKLPGAEFSWETDAGGEPDTAPTPLYPKYNVTRAMLLTPREQLQVDYYRDLRERYHEGPYYSVLDAASSSAKKGSAARVNFDPFHGMPSYSGKYQKKKRTLPKLQGRPYIMRFFPRELWQTIQPSFKPETSMDGYVSQVARTGAKRGFEDDEEEEEDQLKRRRAEDDEEGGEGEDILDPDEEQEEEIVDDNFEDDDDDMGGDYNAEQYFDGGDDEYGDDGFGDGGGGGEEDTF